MRRPPFANQGSPEEPASPSPRPADAFELTPTGALRDAVRGKDGARSTDAEGPTKEPGYTVRDVALRLAGSAIESTRESLCITNADLDDLKIVYVNPAFTEITGYSFSEVVGRSPKLLQGEETDQRVLARLRANLEAGKDFSGRTTNYRKDGSPFVMEWYITEVKGTSGEVTHYLAMQRDRTEEQRREATCLWIEEAIRQTADAVLLVDPNRRIVYANPSFVTLLGSESDSLLGLRLGELGMRLHAENSEAAAHTDRDDALSSLQCDPLDRSIERGEPWQGACRLSRPAGHERRVIVTSTPIRRQDEDSTLDGFLILFRDLTEHLRLESIAHAVNTTENLGYIFSGIRHELGNPINSMKSALAVVQLGVHQFSRDKIGDYLESVLRELVRVEDLLASLRTFNSSERPLPETVELGPFLERLQGMVTRTKAEERLRFEIDAPDKSLSLRADPRALHQILLNLIRNAFEALVERDEGRVVLTVRTRGKWVILSVRDDGPGFEGPSERLLWPFYTTKADGTGLGLAISHRLVSTMGGTLELANADSGGMIATLTLDAGGPSGAPQIPVEKQF